MYKFVAARVSASGKAARAGLVFAIISSKISYCWSWYWLLWQWVSLPWLLDYKLLSMLLLLQVSVLEEGTSGTYIIAVSIAASPNASPGIEFTYYPFEWWKPILSSCSRLLVYGLHIELICCYSGATSEEISSFGKAMATYSLLDVLILSKKFTVIQELQVYDVILLTGLLINN